MKSTILRYRTPVVLAFLLLSVVMLAVYNNRPGFTSSNEKLAINVTTQPIGIINKPIRVERMGISQQSAITSVSTDFSGIISEVYVTEGQTVKAGQPLLKIKANIQPPNDGDVTTSLADKRPGAVQSGYVNYDKALEEYNRYRKLYEIGAVSRRELEAVKAALDKAQAGLSTNPNTGSSSDSSANRTPVGGSVTITAPIDGIVKGLSAKSGGSVQTSQQLLGLGSGQEIEIVVRLSQDDLYAVNLGAQVIAEAANPKLIGQVLSIYPELQADQITAFQAHIKLKDNPGGLLKPGMTVPVSIDTGATQPSFAVPKEAVVRDKQEQTYIYVAVNGKAVQQQVSIGDTVDDLAEIISELPRESLVITSNLDQLKNGHTITVGSK